MGEITPNDIHEQQLANEYFYDGHLRRMLHEFGAEGINFYDGVIKRMGYRPGDIALDIGAGMGDDGKKIAWNYRPSWVFLLEPASPDIDTRYLPLGADLNGRKLKGVEICLPATHILSNSESGGCLV